MTQMHAPPPKPWDTWAWDKKAKLRKEKQRKRTDKTAKTIQKVTDKKIDDKTACQILNCSYYEYMILITHYDYGSECCFLTMFYLDYFVYDVLGVSETVKADEYVNDVKVQEWINKQRGSFKYATDFEKLFKEQIPPTKFIHEHKLSEKEYVGLLVEYLGSPPFLVEDYESIDWNEENYKSLNWD